ncbi:MAG: hypothetical protein ABSF84_00840 [Acidimicrobiales bacterium]
MGPQASERAVALAISGILVSLVLAMLAAVRASPVAIVACGGITFLLIFVLYVPILRGLYRNTREEHQRKALRRVHGLRLVAGEEVDRPPSELPDGAYGYEEIRSVAGLRSGAARIKPDRTDPDGVPYPLEVHIINGEPWLVGYAIDADRHLAEGPGETGELNLWMRRRDGTDVLVEIPLSRVDGDGASLGDRSSDSTARNLFRLVLPLIPSPRPAAPAIESSPAGERPGDSVESRPSDPSHNQ